MSIFQSNESTMPIVGSVIELAVNPNSVTSNETDAKKRTDHTDITVSVPVFRKSFSDTNVLRNIHGLSPTCSLPGTTQFENISRPIFSRPDITEFRNVLSPMSSLPDNAAKISGTCIICESDTLYTLTDCTDSIFCGKVFCATCEMCSICKENPSHYEQICSQCYCQNCGNIFVGLSSRFSLDELKNVKLCTCVLCTCLKCMPIPPYNVHHGPCISAENIQTIQSENNNNYYAYGYNYNSENEYEENDFDDDDYDPYLSDRPDSVS
jgi:hypothetical protein